MIDLLLLGKWCLCVFCAAGWYTFDLLLQSGHGIFIVGHANKTKQARTSL